MLHKPNNNKRISTRRFNSISPTVPEVITNYRPVAVIEIKTSAPVTKSHELKNGMWKLSFDKRTDGNVTTTMVCGPHTMWSVTTSYDDAKSIYNYYLKGWK